MSLKSVVLVGASGNVGKLVLPEIIKSDLQITAITRTGSSAIFPPGVTVVKTDFTLESLTGIFKGKDAVISMIPIASLASQAVVIEAAIAAGVKRFVPSEYGSDTDNEAVIAAVPFFEAKKKYLDLLRSKEDVISWTALFTGPFFDWGLPLGVWGFDLSKKSARLIDGGNTRFTTSNGDQIGRSLAAILKHGDETANKTVFVESFTTTQREVLAALEKVTGETWQVEDVTSDSVRSEGIRLVGEGNLLAGGGALIQALVLGEAGLEDHTHQGVAQWNELLGLPKESVEATVERVLKGAGAV
ncbi:hypothetical protein ACHAQA_005061 [Verticillium albo-atrum]